MSRLAVGLQRLIPALAMLQITDLHKTFVDGTKALSGVSLTLEEDEIVCLLGPSGCGKTTLLRAVAGLEPVDRGSIRLRDQDLRQVPVHKRNFGFMFQEYALFPHKSVADNVAFGLRMNGLDRDHVYQRVDEMLRLVDLHGHTNRSVFELSGGERQRVALARSLAPGPDLLMLDEPLGSLDRTLRETLVVDLRQILKASGVTALYVTHDQEEAFSIGDRIAIMRAGRICQIDSPLEVYQHPADHSVARFLGFSNLLPAVVDRDSMVETSIGHFPTFPIGEHLDPGAYTLLLRPEAARIAYVGDNTGPAYPPLRPMGQESAGQLYLDSTLVSCSFRGSLYHVKVSVANNHDSIHLEFDLPAYQTAKSTNELMPVIIPQPGYPLKLVLFPALFTLLPPTTVSGP